MGLGQGLFFPTLLTLHLLFSSHPIPWIPASGKGLQRKVVLCNCHLQVWLGCWWYFFCKSINSFQENKCFHSKIFVEKGASGNKGKKISEGNVWKYFLYSFLSLLDWIGLVRGVDKCYIVCSTSDCIVRDGVCSSKLQTAAHRNVEVCSCAHLQIQGRDLRSLCCFLTDVVGSDWWVKEPKLTGICHVLDAEA